MIGVIADCAERDVVREFFELFKTPWEFYRGDRHYEILLCSGNGESGANAKVRLIYAGRRLRLDDEQKIPTGSERKRGCILLYRGNRIPIYGDTVTFPPSEGSFLRDEDSQECVAYVDRSGERTPVRVGYDLFAEVRTLLTEGQPADNASMPALDLHIALVRDLITGCGVPLVEVPPVPQGHQFIACLTHDVDHPSIRAHKWDHTVFGFLYRAVFGSLVDVVRGRAGSRTLAANWGAALKLPLVHLGLAEDFWRDFVDRYLKLEKGLRSTFFVIPFRDRAGSTFDGPAPAYRAATYDAQDISDNLHRLLAAGCEVGLHGIDAWCDSGEGREEIEEIRRLTRLAEIGVRMHWLFYDPDSPSAVEQAGAAYDSTVGYNETVGYRAGTTQVYQPLSARRLLELPLHVMDTALFYPDRLGLSSQQARTLLGLMVENAVRFGGCLTVNWHDRSLAPERLWIDCYSDLLHELQVRGAWFSTAGQAVAWFRKRRSVVFEPDPLEREGVRSSIRADRDDRVPGLRLRVHKARYDLNDIGERSAENYVDVPLDQNLDVPVSCEVGS